MTQERSATGATTVPPRLAADPLVAFAGQGWTAPFSSEEQARALDALESGHLVYFPALAFGLDPAETPLLSPVWSSGGAKNISFDPETDTLHGAHADGPQASVLRGMVRRYADAARALLDRLVPSYRDHLERARTSFRPVEVVGRSSSYRKDDKRLHIDAFPSRPVRGGRILRVFSNVNPAGASRVWRVGEPFEAFARQFVDRLSSPLPGAAALLAACRITRGRRSLYDHQMLQLHDHVKADLRYQERAPQVTLELAPGSTWIVYTDQVLHAAMSGQHVLEQTFHLPVDAQRYPERSPLRTLERLTGRTLVGP